ncbi:MAG: ligase-associated DNA damage response endonuclease PdeM [Thermoflavifilum sp.]|uniref:ligase-associated DNA damage response endonuclease PdeM n=1 Tax=Thermoflavifilum sp. TaxID=1968839 RepID=UPI0018A49948|nr:ligase-associated DNA damage response endonuclease PdeM [Thermoflavifilum sp.]QOR76519.1 MAG: ligase-associated DNA damage response endonuclease PdeM [Thermoflavifilum sp.]
MRIVCRGESLILLSEKAIYWEKQSALIVADLHLGKAMHFRKSGIAVPAELNQENLRQLQKLIVRYAPQRVIILGDLFHSDFNHQVEDWMLWRKQFPHIAFHLVKGNHDVLAEEHYQRLQIQLHQEWLLPPFRMVHTLDESRALHDAYFLCGHIHPFVRIKGRARQSAVLPCFYFTDTYAILPAFGKFTGRYLIHPAADARVFAVLGDEVVCISGA